MFTCSDSHREEFLNHRLIDQMDFRERPAKPKYKLILPPQLTKFLLGSDHNDIQHTQSQLMTHI